MTSLFRKGFTLMTATLACISVFPASVLAATQCDTFQFSGHTEQATAQSPFIGTMELTNLANGSSHFVSVTTMLLGYTGPESAITSHEIKGRGTPGIDLVSFDEAQLLATQTPGVFALASRLQVKSGSGAYNCGEMITDLNTSTVNFQTGLGVADYSGFGRLCRCNPSDN